MIQFLTGRYSHVAVSDGKVVLDPFIDGTGAWFAMGNYNRLATSIGWGLIGVESACRGKPLSAFEAKRYRRSKNALDHLWLVVRGRDCVGMVRAVLKSAGIPVPFWALSPSLVTLSALIKGIP